MCGSEPEARRKPLPSARQPASHQPGVRQQAAQPAPASAPRSPRPGRRSTPASRHRASLGTGPGARLGPQAALAGRRRSTAIPKSPLSIRLPAPSQRTHSCTLLPPSPAPADRPPRSTTTSGSVSRTAQPPPRVQSAAPPTRRRCSPLHPPHTLRPRRRPHAFSLANPKTVDFVAVLIRPCVTQPGRPDRSPPADAPFSLTEPQNGRFGCSPHVPPHVGRHERQT